MERARSRRARPLNLILCIAMMMSPFYSAGAQDTVGKIVGDGVTTRSGPGVEYDKIGRLREGNIVNVLNEYERWLMVVDQEGREVWVFSKWVEILPDAPEPTPEPVAEPQAAPNDTLLLASEEDAGEAVEPPPLIAEDDDGGLPWLWIGAGAVAVGGVAALALSGGGGEATQTGALHFDIQFP